MKMDHVKFVEWSFNLKNHPLPPKMKEAQAENSNKAHNIAKLEDS